MGYWGRSKRATLAVMAVIVALLLSAIVLTTQPPEPTGAVIAGQSSFFSENTLFRYNVNRYSANAEVSNRTGDNLSIGVSTETWNLNFGIVPTGGSYGTRHLTLKNSENEDVVIQLKAYGDIAPFVEFSANDFTLGKDGSASIDIVFRTQKGTPVGNYGGEIDIFVRQPKYPGSNWIDGVL